MPKRATKVVLSEKEQEELTQISKRHRSEQQMALRARMVLAAAQGHANAQQPRITAEQRCQMAALACEAPSKAGRPISQWTGREIADEMKARGIVEQISPRHAARLLKKGACNRIGSGIG